MSHGVRPAFTALEQALGRVSVRVRLLRALRGLALYATLGGLAAALAGLLVATGALDPADRERVWGLAGLLSAWGFVLGWLRAPALLSTALLVDRTHPFGGRLSAGVELSASGQGGEMGRLAIADALARARSIQPERALPLTRPAYARAAGLALLAALIAATLAPPVPVEAALSAPPPRVLRPLAVHADDLAVLRDAVTALPERERSPEVQAEIAAINELIEALSREELDRTEALRRLGEIAEGLREGRAGALEATLEALAPMARPLSRSRLTDPVAEALAAHDPEAAATELERLAERMEREPPSAAELERLREAMAAAADAMDPETLRREREALEEQRDRLLHREEEERAMSDTERAAREEERERELERLRRAIDERREREEELESLRRELDEMMREEERSSGGAGSEEERSAMERAAEDLRRYADEAAGEREREDLAREVEAMRELVRRMREGGSGESGSNGEGAQAESEGSGQSGGSRMDRFVLRARGEGDEGEGEGLPIGTPGSGGEEGEGESEGSAGTGGAGEREDGATGTGSGAGEEGEGEGAGRGEMLMLGRGEDRLMLPGMGESGSGGERGPGSGEGEGESEGDGAGTGGGRGSSDDPTGRGGEHTTVRVAGEEGAGPTRSEVIRTSAARGFASRDYRDVYGDYRRHADETLEDEEIPPGYRFYVERYFQLIRPRE